MDWTSIDIRSKSRLLRREVWKPKKKICTRRFTMRNKKNNHASLQVNSGGLTWSVGPAFRRPAGVHRGQLAVQYEPEPAVRAVGKFKGGRVRPNVEAVPAAAHRPVSPVICLPGQDLLCVLDLICFTRFYITEKNIPHLWNFSWIFTYLPRPVRSRRSPELPEARPSLELS